MKITSCAKTDVGKKRPRNEDNFLIDPDLDAYVVADGMGGYAGGDVASELAVSTIDEVLSQALAVGGDAKERRSVALRRAIAALGWAIRAASAKIRARADADPALQNMGTTTVAMMFRLNHVLLANVGDSRAYRIRDGVIEQLTNDHSLVAEQVRAGLITPEAARTSRLKNLILRSVGVEPDVEVDTFLVPVEQGDLFLLCSDGLSTMMADVEIREAVLGAVTVESAVDRLVEQANARGGEDNVTVVLARVDGLDAPPDEITDTFDTRTPDPTPTPTD